MDRKQLTGGFLALVLAACAGPRESIRSEMTLTGDPMVTLDGLTVSARALDLQTIKGDPRFSRTVKLNGSALAAALIGHRNFWTVIDPPAFELRIRNQTGHVVRLNGVVIKLIGPDGTSYDALDHASARAELEESIAAARARGIDLSAASASELVSAQKQLKFLSENAQLLPEVSETFIVAFATPVGRTEKEVNDWLARQSSFRLKVFDIPTRTDAAGAVTKRVSFEFPVVVKTFRETYEDGPEGKRLVSTQELTK